jgi:hypothetical protein
MPTIRARVTVEANAGGKTILAPPTVPAIAGDGSLDIICGGCGAVLIEHARPYLNIRSILIRCPRCHQCNDPESPLDAA